MLVKQDLKRDNFDYTEFFKSNIAKENNIINYPPAHSEQDILNNLMFIADTMQELRELFKAPILINSAYRCLKLNKLIGSSDNSQHVQGLACDFRCPSFGSPERIMKFLYNNNYIVDQCLCEGSWLHLSKVPDMSKNRKMYGYYLLSTEYNKRVFQPYN